MRRVPALLIALLLPFAPAIADAQNPAWPNRSATREQLMDPANWPDDPNYGYDISGTGMSCIPGGRCWTNATGGQWNMWSWVPPQAVASVRPDEIDLGAGTWTDMAWTVTTGDPRVVIAVLDSGINWDERDLVNQYYINRAELEGAMALDARCLPQPPAGHTGDPIDVDGNGYLSMRDWFAGKSAAEIEALTAELDGMGNRNGVAEPGDLIVLCSNGMDEGGNGYVDDISGWDFHHDDNDPQDDTRFGHGTGEARWSMAEANNGMGRIGFCPGCRALMVRAGDSFVVDAQDYAQAVIFAVDSGARVVQEALGSVNNTTYMRRANDYAYANDVLIVASAADENSRHHNMPGTSNHTLYVHATQYAGGNPQSTMSYHAFNNCTNYGGQLALSAPGTGCSSEATAVTSGIAGLVYSAAIAADRPGGPLDPPLRTEEMRQLLMMQADDIWLPESQPGHPMYNSQYYPSREGWDQRFGYGRINAHRAVVAVREGRIPPEVDLTYPDWFRVIYPDQTPQVTLRGAIAARRAASFDYVIEWARGIEPDDADFEEIASMTGATAPIEGDLATWDVSALNIDNDGEVENRFTVTVRIRVTAHYGGAIGDVLGEQRRAYAIHRDPSLLPGWPVALGVRNEADPFPAASGEGSAKLADLDGDADLEVVYADADGLLHAFQEDGTELPGYPVQLGVLRGLDAAAPSHILGSRAYAMGFVPSDDVASSVVAASAAIGDLNGDGTLEIVTATMEGDVFAFHAPDATPVTGWPVGLPDVPSGDTLRGGPPSREHIVERGIFGAPALYDLDGDGNLEVIVAGFDGKVHVFRHDGSIQPGFPVELVARELWMDPAAAKSGRIMTSPAIGDANGDGIPDIAVGSNEEGDDSNTGAVHLVHGDGNMHPGGPEHAGWPIVIDSFHLLPLVGEGVTSPLSMADVNRDGRPDIAMAGAAGRITIVDAMQPPRMPGDSAEAIVILDSSYRGPLSNITDGIDKPMLNTFAAGAFGDLNGDGQPDFVTGGAGLKLAANLAGGWENQPFSHQVGVWDTMGGKMLPGFPQRIEDYMFFVNPSVADVSGDNYPEVVIGSGGYYLHAWDACGREAEGFPKFVGSWITGSAALGDVDGDGMLDVAIATRMGYLYVFRTNGPANGVTGWSEYRHDNRNTGNFEEPLSNGGVPMMASQPIECPIPPPADGGLPDGGVGGGEPGGGGCGCRVAKRESETEGLLAALAMIAVVAIRRRRRARR